MRLDDHDVRLLKLNEETHQHRADFLRYKEDNDNVINEIKDALARYINWDPNYPLGWL